MQEVKQKRYIPIGSAISCAIVPIFYIVIGFMVLFETNRPSFIMIVGCFILPVLTYVLCLFILSRRLKPWLKSLICLIISALLFVLSFFIFFLAPAISYDIFIAEDAIAQYKSDIGSYGMDEIIQDSHLRSAENVSYHCLTVKQAIFIAQSRILICSYDELEYTRQKGSLCKLYDYVNSGLPGPEGDADPHAMLSGFSFSIVDRDDVLPKTAHILGFNDESNEIAFVFYSDVEQDFVYSMESYLLDDCGWKYITR